MNAKLILLTIFLTSKAALGSYYDQPSTPEKPRYGHVCAGVTCYLVAQDGTKHEFPTNGYRYGALDRIAKARQLAMSGDLNSSVIDELIVAYVDQHSNAPDLGYEMPYYANAESQRKVNKQHQAVTGDYQRAKRALKYLQTRDR